MRKIALFAILFAFSATLSAQEESRFSTVGASVVWQNVYQTQLDSAAVVDGMIASGHFDNIILTKDGFTCRIIPHEVDYRGAGMKRGLTSMYLLDGDLECRAVVQIREGRYRVTVDEMVFTGKISSPLSKPGERTKLELYALNGSGKFRSNFWNKGSSPVLDYDLYSLFEIKETAAQDEDW
jgi:hypothetical protein